jgi:hypothetical protein
MDNDPRSIQPPIRYSRGDRLHPCRNRDAEILPHRELRPARATRISGPNSIGMSTGLGKLRARIKRLGQGQWVRLPTIPTECGQSYHMFYLILPSLDHRQGLIWHLSQRQIFAVHYLPPHVSPMGLRFGGHQGDCPGTEDFGRSLVAFSIFQRNANGANLGDALRRAGTRQQLSGSPRFAQTRLKKFRRKTLLS